MGARGRNHVSFRMKRCVKRRTEGEYSSAFSRASTDRRRRRSSREVPTPGGDPKIGPLDLHLDPPKTGAPRRSSVAEEITAAHRRGDAGEGGAEIRRRGGGEGLPSGLGRDPPQD